MNTYLVSYDLIAPGQKYKVLGDLLRSFPNWAKVLESTWVIKTPWTAAQVRDRLQREVDGNDKLLVITVSRDAAWFNLPDDVSKWLKENL